MEPSKSTKIVSIYARDCVVACLWCCLFLVSAPAKAEWHWIHGHTGHIEYLDRLEVQVQKDKDYAWYRVEQAGINSHQAGDPWCQPGWYIVALDLDGASQLRAHDSPVIGQVLCARAVQPICRRGWGLDFLLQHGASNWVHFAIPTPQAKRVARIGLRFETNTPSAKVTRVDVYNGETKVQEFKGSWSDGKKEIELSLSKPVKFDRGLGISVGVEAVSIEPNIDYRFRFFSIGADIVD